MIDRAAILRGSAVGQNIMKQVQQLTIAAENGLKAKDAALRKEGAALQQQLAILAPGVKAAKIKAFEAKQAALQGEVQRQQGLIQGGVLVARQQVEQALGPILQKIMQERGANLLLDRNAVVLGTVDVDITGAGRHSAPQPIAADGEGDADAAAAGSRAAASNKGLERFGMADPRFYDNRGPFTLR